jgi:hypothetical protein
MRLSLKAAPVKGDGTPSRSLAQQLRSDLKVKGKTTHSGRGFYDCTSDVPWEEFLKRVKACLPDWQEEGLIDAESVTDTEIDIWFIADAFGSYRKLSAKKDSYSRRNEYQIVMKL